MNRIRLIGTCIAIGGVAMLTGCVAVPGDPVYGGAVYSEPYYASPAPVYVAPAPVYIEGNYYSRPRYPHYYGRPGYYGRPDYDRPSRPGFVPRPGSGSRPLGPRPEGSQSIAPPPNTRQGAVIRGATRDAIRQQQQQQQQAQ